MVSLSADDTAMERQRGAPVRRHWLSWLHPRRSRGGAWSRRGWKDVAAAWILLAVAIAGMVAVTAVRKAQTADPGLARPGYSLSSARLTPRVIESCSDRDYASERC